MHKVSEIFSRVRRREYLFRTYLDLFADTSEKHDEERIKFVLQHLSEHEKPIDMEKKGKSTSRALAYNQDGRNKFVSSPWEDLIDIFTKAAMHAEIDSNELARAYGNRSAALYTGGLYEDALIDIERALKIGYSDSNKTKLYVRRAKCFFALEKKISPNALEALADARKWLDKMNDVDKKYMTNILVKFPKNLSIKEPFKKYDYDKLMPKPPQDNPKLPGVSGAIELKYSKKFGRHIVATKNINAGETILVHKSYATIIDAKFSHKYCWYCCKRVWSGVPCHQCINVIYCNENCRDEAWMEYHDIECQVLSATTRTACPYDAMALRITVKAYKEAGTLKKLQQKILKINAIDDPIMKCLTNNVFDHTKYASVYSLWRHCKTVFGHALKASLILYSLAATTDIFGKKITKFKELLNNECTIFIGGLIMANLEIAIMNVAKLNVDDNAGFALDPFWSLFNHDCDPQTISFTSGVMTTLTTFQRLKKGQQICVNYGRAFLFATLPERRKLHQDFEFWCECIACNKQWEPSSILSFPCYKYSPAELQKKLALSTTFGKFDHISVMMTANNDDSIVLIPDLFTVLDFYHRVHGYPNRQIMEIKMIVADIFSSLRYKYK